VALGAGVKTDDIANSVKKANCFTAIDHNRNQTTDKRILCSATGVLALFPGWEGC